MSKEKVMIELLYVVGNVNVDEDLSTGLGGITGWKA